MNKYIKFVLAMLCLYTSADAQNSTTTFTHIADSTMQFLPKYHISNLYNRVFPFAGLQYSNLTGDTVSYSYFKQAFSELERCNYTFIPVDSIVSFKDLNSIVKGAKGSNSLPVFITNTKLYFIDSTATADGRLIDSLGYIVAGNKVGIPYDSVTLKFTTLGIEQELNINTNYNVQVITTDLLSSVPIATNVNIASVKVHSALSNKTISFTAAELLHEPIFSFTKAGLDYITSTIT